MASYEESLVSISLPAADSLATFTGVVGTPGVVLPDGPNGNQYRFVYVNSSGEVEVADTAVVAPVGVLQNVPQVGGQAATVGILGVSMVELGANTTAGVLVAPDADGKAVAALATKAFAGLTLNGGSTGELVPVLLMHGVA